jgi:hypothetical protein
VPERTLAVGELVVNWLRVTEPTSGERGGMGKLEREYGKEVGKEMKPNGERKETLMGGWEVICC